MGNELGGRQGLGRVEHPAKWVSRYIFGDRVCHYNEANELGQGFRPAQHPGEEVGEGKSKAARNSVGQAVSHLAGVYAQFQPKNG